MRLYASKLVFAAIILVNVPDVDGVDVLSWKLEPYETAEECLKDYLTNRQDFGLKPEPNECQDEIDRSWVDYIDAHVLEATFSREKE